MSCKPTLTAEPGSLHVLLNRHGGGEKIFEWTGDAWSTPGTGYGTKPGTMAVLGWKYIGPQGLLMTNTQDALRVALENARDVLRLLSNNQVGGKWMPSDAMIAREALASASAALSAATVQPVAWAEAQRICDLPAVDEAIRNLLADQTGNNAACMVQVILEELANQQTTADASSSSKAVYWFSVLVKCARLLNLPDSEPIPSGVLAAVEKLAAVNVHLLEQKAVAFDEWIEKTKWVQEQIKTFPTASLGKHYADVMREEIERLRSNAALQEPLQVVCCRCNGTGWIVRDPDIGTDQECSVCDGTGTYEDA